MLSERQIEILKSKGLPTEYDQLTGGQKSAILAIEDMMLYLDKKYPNEVFRYSGYVEGMLLEKEHLFVDCKYGEVTVYRDLSVDPPAYEDTYNEAKASIVYEDIIRAFVSRSIDQKDFTLSVSVGKCTSEDWTEETLLSLCSVDARLFVRESVGEEHFDKMCQELSEYLGQNSGDNGVSVGFYLIKEDRFYSELPSAFDGLDSTVLVLKEKQYDQYPGGSRKFY